MQLRPYQQEAVNSVFENWNTKKRCYIEACTGSGKTIMFSKIAQKIAQEGGRTLIIAHRKELLEQAADKIFKSTGLSVGYEWREKVASFEHKITIASLQTILRAERLSRVAENESNWAYTHVIIDEAHHATSASYQRVIEALDHAKLLGVTATPARSDKKHCAQVFDECAYSYPMPRAVKDGYLVPPVVKAIDYTIDLRGLETVAGDFADADLGDRIEPYIESIVDAILPHIIDRKTVIFLPLIKTSILFEEALKKRGIEAYHVDGQSEDREEILQKFDSAGKSSVICNAMLLTEGWDSPSADCILVLRPTQSAPLYQQMVGRGLRLSPETGKKDCIILDLLYMSDKLLQRPSCLVSASDEVNRRMTELLNEQTAKGEKADILKAMDEAEAQLIHEREEAMLKRLYSAGLARKDKQSITKRKTIDPITWGAIMHDNTLLSWDNDCNVHPATENQLSSLEKLGFEKTEIESKEMASALMDSVAKRSTQGLCTPKQMRMLMNFGIKGAETKTFLQAQNYITRIAENGWRKPYNMV